MPYCHNCGEEVAEGVNFCPGCGANQKVQKQPAEAQVSEETGDDEGASVGTVVFTILFVAFTCGVCGWLSSLGDEDDGDTTAAAEETTSYEDMSLEERVEALASETFGDELQKIELDEVSGGVYRANIAFMASDNFTKSMVRRGIIMDAMDFVEEAVQNQAFDQVAEYRFLPRLTLVSEYGEENVRQVGELQLDRATAEKINWSNMTTDGFERLVRRQGSLYFHPALQD